MFTNYLKVALRNLVRHKAFSFINLLGLSIGMACAVLILFYVRHELSYDQYHAKKDRIFRLVTKVQGAAYEAIAKVPGPWGMVAKQDMPEVQEVTRFVFFNETLVSRGEKRFYEEGGLYADPTVFEVFSFSLLKGNPKTALTQPNTVVITRDFAQKYFGDEEPLGQRLRFDNRNEYLVTGVMPTIPANSHFTFDFLVSMATYTNPRRDDWQWLQYYTYLLLKEGMSPQAVVEKFPALLRRNFDENAASAYTPFLQPLTDIHLRSHFFREMQANSDIASVYIFSAVAFFILLIACINFMNLTTARAATRAKEVAVRKVSGADQGQLIKQFLGESILISLSAMILALFLVVLLLPVFNSLIGRQLTQNFRDDKAYLLIQLGITLGVGLVSGSYPAFVLSALKPVNVLKKKWAGARGAGLRQGLVVFQFGISAFLMIATGIVYSQLKYIQNIKLGFNKEQLVIIPIRDEAVRMKYETLKRELLQDPNVVSVAASGNLPGGSDWGIPYEAEGLPPDKTPPMRVLAVDHDFVATFEMELAAGRSFSRDHSNDAKTYMVNEEAAKQLGWKDPVGKTIAMAAIQREKAPVIGVLKDFHFRSLHEKIGPIMFFIPPPDWFTVFSVRIRSENISKTLAALERIWAKFDPSHPFNYTFFDEQFDRLHQNERQIGRLLGYVALLAVIIACLGLFGLATFTAEQRTKEIGIRKVLGASAGGIIFLLSKDFAKLALIGFIIAAPLAYFSMSRWLGDFAYRANIGWGVFVLSGLLALVTTWLTVSYQSTKAALANPVDSLHYE